MRPMPSYQKPSFRIPILAVILAGTYAFAYVAGNGLDAMMAGMALDLVVLLIFIQLCLFYYAQFVAPVRQRAHRVELHRRLLLHLLGAHGPAVFVKNGRVVERRGERSKPGPGLLWLDTGSAVVTRSENGASRALGPGVHFTTTREQIASTFSLHTQICVIGPDVDDQVFEPLPDDAPAEERMRHAETQATRMSVTARTRDGNEVVPEIQVVFKLDAMPARPGTPGSRFGFMEESVLRAARGEGISAGSTGESPSHVAWNQLPSLIAVDLWREYLSKFTLDELFKSNFPALPEILQPQEPASGNSAAINQPSDGNPAARFVGHLNDLLERWLDTRGIKEEISPGSPFVRAPEASPRRQTSGNHTALEIVGQMMRERMTKAVVPILDDCGRLLKGHVPSEEFKRLKERGVSVLDVTIGGVRFDPAVENQIVQHWSTAWLATARNDGKRVEQLELLAIHAGRQQALLEHATALSEAVRRENPQTIPAAVGALLRSTQDDILTNERLSGRGGSELEKLSQILRWVETGNHE
jgi:hypothetical protein